MQFQQSAPRRRRYRFLYVLGGHYTIHVGVGKWHLDGPSHAFITTGFYPTGHGVYDEDVISRGNVAIGNHPTLGEKLKMTLCWRIRGLAISIKLSYLEYRNRHS